MQKITPCLWFNDNCEEAINYYIQTFNQAPNPSPQSKIISIQRYEEGMQTPGIENMIGKIITVIYELRGQRFMALDGGDTFKLSEATSFYIECEDQAEVDYFWEKLSHVPESEQCGWAKDKFGLSWQIVPKRMEELITDPDKDKSLRVINAMLNMKKLDIAELEKAYSG